MKIATWNVNGIRARQVQLEEWIKAEQPDVICLQEIKAAPEQIPESLVSIDGYWCYWHGGKGYSGVGLHVRKDVVAERPNFFHPAFDHEHRVVAAAINGLLVVSIYVPNGGKDFAAKMQFFAALDAYVAAVQESATPLVVCGDINIAHSARDVHPRERKDSAIGQLPEERAAFDHLLGQGLVDVARALHPDADDLFTWWAPWRNLRQRNIGWRIDYILASQAVATRATKCEAYREVGTSDHGPVVATFTWP
ncbi:MAG TPA: exodeoxyribonuclease III [Polyangia bacterium]